MKFFPSPNHLDVAIYEPFGSGGICHYTFQLANAIAESGQNVVVITNTYELATLPRRFELNTQLAHTHSKRVISRLMRRRDSGEDAPSISSPLPSPAHRLPVARRSFWTTALRRWMITFELLLYVLVRRPSVVHIQWLLEPRHDLFLIRMLKRLGFPIIYTAHNAMPHTLYTTDDVRILSALYSLVDHIIVHAHRNADTLRKDFQVNANKITTIPHGKYDMFFSQEQLAQTDVRASLGLPHEKVILLFFGAIRRYKGLEYLVSAFEEVSRECIDALLLVVGSIPHDDPAEYGFYTELGERLRKRRDVVVKTEYVPWDKIGRYFVASDIVVLPYVHTYQSGILFLAYAAGRPVIATDTGGLCEAVEHGKTGFVVPVKDIRAMANGILALVRDPALRQTMGRNAAHLAETKYSWRGIAERTIDLYHVVARR